MMIQRGKSLTLNLVHDLGLAIVTGQYTEDNPFPTEAKLCEKYDVSRSIIREAVKMLTAKGLLSARPRQGTKVRPEEDWRLLDSDVLGWFLKRKLSLPLLREFTQIRLAIEPAAAALAATKSSPENIEGLRAALNRMEEAAKGHDDPFESDVAFHIALLEASENRFFKQLKSLCETALHFSIRYTNQQKGVRFADVEAHKNVLDAIEQGNPALAQEKVRKLLYEAIHLLDDEEHAKS